MQFSKTGPSLGTVCIYFLILITFAFVHSARSEDAVDIKITSYDQHDTVWATWPSTLDIYIANSEEMCGFALGHQVWSPDGAEWQWLDADGWGYSHIVTPNLDSRWGDMTCYDMAVGLVTEQNIDEIGRDTIMMGSAGMLHCCPSGPLEHMYSYNFRMRSSEDPEDLRTICIDSCFVPPAGPFVFYDYTGNAYPPQVLWPNGGRCWPVKLFPYLCGDANFDGAVNVGDVVFIIGFVFTGGPTPDPYCQADANGSHPVDVGDAVYLINYIFKSGSPPMEPCCP